MPKCVVCKLRISFSVELSVRLKFSQKEIFKLKIPQK